MAPKKTLQRVVLALQGRPPFRELFRLYYRGAALLFAGATRRSFPQVKEIFLRRGQTKTGWVPGASDLDFGVIVTPFAEISDEIAFLKRFWARYGRWKRFLPILGEIQIVDENELAIIRSVPSLRQAEYGAPAPTGWRLRWECLSEALFSCLHLLEQAYFSSARGGLPPDFGIKIAKGVVDTLRFAEAAAQGRHPAERASFRLDEDLKALLRSPIGLDRPRARLALIAVLRRLDGHCRAFIDDARAAGFCGKTLPEPSPWPRDIDEEAVMLWNGRMKIFDEEPGYPKVRGFYYDSLFRWLVVAEADDDAALGRLIDKLAGFPAENDVFRAPAWLLPPAAFKALLWTPHLSTPFFYEALSPELQYPNTAGRRRSRFAVESWAQRGQWRMKASDFTAPPAEFARWGAQACAAGLTLSLRLFGLDGWAGDNIYRLIFLYSRLLSLQAYFKAGLAADPDNLPGLLALLGQGSPDLHSKLSRKLMDALESPPQEWQARPAAGSFYMHYPNFRALLEDLLAASSQ